MRRPKSFVAPLSILIVGLIIFVGAFIGWNYTNSIFQPASSSTKKISLNVQQGETANQIAVDLQNKGVIRNAQAFSLWAKIRGLDTKLEAGVYNKITPAMTTSQIIDILQTGQPDELLVTIPEGVRLEQIADIVATSNFPDFSKTQFLGYVKKPKTFPDASKYTSLLSGIPNGDSMEGLLFPDTYELAPTSTASDVIDAMLTEMNTKITQNKLATAAKANQMSLYQFVTLASIVQREAGNAGEMPNIASVYWDRLYNDNGSNGQPSQTNGFLQADPTVQYARDTDTPPTKYWTPLADAGSKIATNNLWNTYINAGLPPTPICSPGLTSLKAAANPPKTGYLFFFAAKSGKTYFQKTLDEFNAQMSQYGLSN